MQVHWHCYRFNYTRYLELSPLLRVATTPEAFATVATTPETAQLVQEIFEEELTPEEARPAFVQALCCLDDPVLLDQGFPRLLALLEQRSQTEDAAALLSKLLTGGHNLEPWLLPTSLFLGFLTPEETSVLFLSYMTLARRGGFRLPVPKGKRRRRGGVLSFCVRFVRRLFDRDPQPEDTLRLLGNLIHAAVQRGEGIAITTS